MQQYDTSSLVQLNRLSANQSIMFHPTCFDWGFYDPQMAGSIDGTDLIPHDRALTRASQSTYQPPHHSSSFFVGHIPPSCTEKELAEIFPNATRIDLIRDVVTREAKGYAFLDGRIDRKKEYRVRGHVLLVEDVASKNVVGWKPRRCGGGLGGKKESGQLRFGGSERPFKKVFQTNEQIKQRWKDLEKQRDQSLRKKKN